MSEAMSASPVAIAALIVSIATLGFGYLTLRQTASKERIEGLEERIRTLEGELRDALKLAANLRDENIDLLRRLFVATGGRRDMPD